MKEDKQKEIKQGNTIEDSKFVERIGRIASFISILMYVSYIPQILDNLHGKYGSPIQPLVAMINCIFWVAYALLKKQRDWPIFWANVPGIVFGLLAFLTSLH